MKGYRKVKNTIPPSEIFEAFGIRSGAQVFKDLRIVISQLRSHFKTDPSSLDALRPDLSIPAYLGMVPEDGISPIYNLFDRECGGNAYSSVVTRNRCRDFRGKVLTYDDHDGVDFVCPPGTNLCAAAPGTVVMIRDYWLRGGITVGVDHGNGMITQYTHCWRPLVEIGQKIRRGEPVALSGVAGIDLTLFFPWVPPHVHFMVWINGRPQDPYLLDGEEDRPGTWMHRNDPRPSEINNDEKIPKPSAVDEDAVDEIVSACTGERVREHLKKSAGNYQSLAAIIEDALHHEDWAWPEGFRHRSVRPKMPQPEIRISMPLPADTYCGARFSDTTMSFNRLKKFRY